MKIIVFVFVLAISYSYMSFAQSCDYNVKILVDKEEFEKEDFKWRMRATKIEGKSTNITGMAKIQANGKTVKSYKPWTSQAIAKQKTSSQYSPNLNPGAYEIVAEIEVECDDINKENNADKKEIRIKEEAKIDENKSENIGTNRQTQNEEKSSTISNAENTLTIKSKQLNANDETANVIELVNKNTQKIQKTQLTAAITQPPETVYVSSNEKAKGWIMVFLLTLSVLLNIILIWKR